MGFLPGVNHLTSSVEVSSYQFNRPYYEGLEVTESSHHKLVINSRFQSQIWPIFENHAIKNPAHLGILRARGGSSAIEIDPLIAIQYPRNMPYLKR